MKSSAAFLMMVILSVSACSGDDDAAGERRDTGTVSSEPDMTISMPDLPPAPERVLCAEGITDGTYLEAHLDNYCLDGTGRVLSRITFFQCTGCEGGPLACTECERTPTHYVQINLTDWDIDMSGRTFTQDDTFGVNCRIGGGCDEISAWSVTLSDHVKGECAAGTYRFEYVGGLVEEGRFDAGAFEPPTSALLESCTL